MPRGSTGGRRPVSPEPLHAADRSPPCLSIAFPASQKNPPSDNNAQERIGLPNLEKHLPGAPGSGGSAPYPGCPAGPAKTRSSSGSREGDSTGSKAAYQKKPGDTPPPTPPPKG